MWKTLSIESDGYNEKLTLERYRLVMRGIPHSQCIGHAAEREGRQSGREGLDGNRQLSVSHSGFLNYYYTYDTSHHAVSEQAT